MRDNYEDKFAKLESLVEIILSDVKLDTAPTHWTNWMRVALKYIKRKDLTGVRFFWSAHGGMGRNNDWAPLSADGWTADTQARDLAIRFSSKVLLDSEIDYIFEH